MLNSASQDGVTGMVKMLGEWVAVAEGAEVMGVRTEMVALLGGVGDHAGGLADGHGDVSEGGALGASCGRHLGNPTSSSVFLSQCPQPRPAMTLGSHRTGAGVVTVGKLVTPRCSSVTLATHCRAAQRSAA